MRRDTIFYQLFRQSPTLLFDLISQPPVDADLYTFDSIEVKETSFRMDGVFVPPNPSGTVYFCEVQFQPDELLYERILSEISIYIYRHRNLFSDWRAIVIYPSRSLEQSDRNAVVDLLASGRIVRVYLDELGAVSELPIGLGLMVLTTLEGDEAKAEARRLVDLNRNSGAIINLVSTIVLYKFGTLSRDEVDLMLGTELQQTRVYQEAKADGRTEEGQLLVMKQLTRKLGNISPEVRSRVTSLTIDLLESLGEDLLDFTQISDLLAWLDMNQL
jgi:predicted transposase/invertase (TIGR01784 family)